MNRRNFIGKAATATGGLAVVGLLGQEACKPSKSDLVRWTDQVIVALQEGRAVFVQAGLTQILEFVDKAVEIAKQLRKAFEDADSASALTFLAALLDPDGVIQSIALAVGLLQSEAQKRVVATVLIVIRLALNLIVAAVGNAPKLSGLTSQQRTDAGTVMATAAPTDTFVNAALVALYGMKAR